MLRNVTPAHDPRVVIGWKFVVALLVLLISTPGAFARVDAATQAKRDVTLNKNRVTNRRPRPGVLVQHIQERYSVPPKKARTIVEAAFRRGAELELSPELILAVIAVESTFREQVVSRAGARGLMQIVPKWHPEKIREIGGPQALFDPAKNIRVGTRILVQYLDRSDGDLRKALLRYNGSLKNPRSRYADKVLNTYQSLQKAASASA